MSTKGKNRPDDGGRVSAAEVYAKTLRDMGFDEDTISQVGEMEQRRRKIKFGFNGKSGKQ